MYRFIHLMDKSIRSARHVILNIKFKCVFFYYQFFLSKYIDSYSDLILYSIKVNFI